MMEGVYTWVEPVATSTLQIFTSKEILSGQHVLHNYTRESSVKRSTVIRSLLKIFRLAQNDIFFRKFFCK